MKKKNFVSGNGGYSVIEVMVILAISAILLTFAVTQFGTSKTQFKRQNLARELKVNLERARFDSVKRRADVTTTGGVTTDSRAEVKLLSPTTFSVKTDMNQNGALDAAETRTIDFSGQSSSVKIVGSGLIFPITISFDRYGRITAKNGASPQQNITPIFTICTGEATTAANATAANADVIYVSPSGTVAMLAGGSNQPTFQKPAVASKTPTESVNPSMQVEP